MSGYSLTYIYHDCFILETSRAVVIFDYWKDPLSTGETKDFPPLLDEIPQYKKIYILVSHHHKDHFSRRVFLWKQRFPNMEYVISADTFRAVSYLLREGGTYQGYRAPLDSIHVLVAGQEYRDEDIKVKAFPSTDIGNSYAVEINGKKIFHAGDLNAWLWIEESTQDEVDGVRNQFRQIITEIKGNYPFFDLVLFPVDSRLGREYWWGAKYFVETIRTALFVPMHFELVLSEEDKEQRRIDAAAFNLFAHKDYGTYLQLASSRSRYVTY